MVTKENLHMFYHMWNGKYKRLTREFEANLPEFESHKEARTFFKDLFGDDFMITGTDMIDGEKLWRYTYVINRPAWEQIQKDLEEKGHSADMEGFMATHEFQIFDDGSLHIVY